ncbi:asparagine synthase (glutamine-hydrolyzing), partial [Kaarinaea lacus]
MCGIACIYQLNKEPVVHAVIERMVHSLAHRGPDDLKHIQRGPVSLGHARLSIVDIKGGKQPMLSDDGRYALVFNGEIYNFESLRAELESQGSKFLTNSDTEVVLRLFERDGINCLSLLRGMFAIAIHDNDTDQLFIARDRLGIKPLFYYQDGQALVAASEIKAIFASGLLEPRLNPVSVRNYFRYQFAVSPYTVFQSVYELPPGHFMVIGADDNPEIKEYWDIQFPRDNEYESLDENYWLKEFTDALDDAAASHTIGDVPIGAYLSGGIESAATTQLLARHTDDKVQSYTIQFSNKEHDESQLAKEIADHLSIPNKTIYMDEQREQGYLGELLDCVYHLEQPQRMAVDIPHFLLSDLVRSDNKKVVYTGDGSDEIFGGYDCYRQDYIRYWGNQKKNTRERRKYYLNEFRDDFAEAQMRMLFELHRPKRQRSTVRKYGCYPAWYDFWHHLDDVTETLFDNALLINNSDQLDDSVEKIRNRIDGLHMLNQSLYIETKTRLPGWILWKSDRLSMAHSVEARVPFLDHPLVELVARIPPGLKLNGMDEKYLLRKLMMPLMPEHPTYFKKRAFYTPIREWFFTPERQDELMPYMSDEALESAGFFRPEIVRQYLEEINAFGQPQNLDQYYFVMKLEWVLFLVLTVQMLHYLFVER